MNKKFLSAILFGALMVTSTGTFVSCKDYDDDIDRLDQEISNVKDAIKALEDKVGSGKYVESCTPFTDGNGGYEIKFSDGEASCGVSALVRTCSLRNLSAQPIRRSKSPEMVAAAVLIFSP